MSEVRVFDMDHADGEKNVPIVLPCSTENFREFISGLLGQPQEIDGGEFGSFCVEKKNIEQIYHLVTQRVFQQNGVHPISVNVRIAYDDGTSINLNSIGDFQSFNEPKPVVSTECHISFVYLIQFPTTAAPEKQEITVSYVSSQESSRRRHLATFAESPFALFARGYIGYRIRYTARTWGADVESLLKNYIKDQMVAEAKYRNFIRIHSAKFASFIAGLFFTFVYLAVTSVYDEVMALYLKELGLIFGGGVTISEKIDVLIKILISGSLNSIENTKLGIIIASIFVSIILIFIIETKADSRRPSFVILTNKASDKKEQILKKYDQKILHVWGSIVLGVLIGLATNFIYDYYAKNKMSNVLDNIRHQMQISASNSPITKEK